MSLTRTEISARYRARNLEKVRAADRERRKRKLADKAIADGREPGILGRARRLTDVDRLQRSRAKSLAYWEKNPKKRKAMAKQYYEANKERVAANIRNRRARLRLVEGSHSASDIRWLREQQKGKCAFCLGPFGKQTPHIDHYVPVLRGGSNDVSNLRLLHEKCNKRKAAKDPLEFAQSCGLLCW